MSTEVLIAIVTVVLTGLGMVAGGAVFLVRVGGHVAKMQHAADTVQKVADRLDRIPAIEQHLVLQDARLDRIETRTDSAHAHAMRAEFVSTHGE